MFSGLSSRWREGSEREESERTWGRCGRCRGGGNRRHREGRWRLHAKLKALKQWFGRRVEHKKKDIQCWGGRDRWEVWGPDKWWEKKVPHVAMAVLYKDYVRQWLECAQGQIIQPTQIFEQPSMKMKGNITLAYLHKPCSRAVSQFSIQYILLRDPSWDLALILGRGMYRHEIYNRTVENIAISTKWRLFNEFKSGLRDMRWGEKCIHERYFSRERVKLNSDVNFECQKIFFESSVGSPVGKSHSSQETSSWVLGFGINEKSLFNSIPLIVHCLLVLLRNEKNQLCWSAIDNDQAFQEQWYR